MEAGAEILYIEAQDSQFQPAPSRYAFQHIRGLIDAGPGIRVGDADTYLMAENGSRMAAPEFIQDQMLLEAFPSVWVVRKRDMRLIADQNRSNFYLPLSLIVADPDIDWSDPPPPPFRSNCLEGEDEELLDTECQASFMGDVCVGDDDCMAPSKCDEESERCTQGICDGRCDPSTDRCLEPNDSIFEAKSIEIGMDYQGGICNERPDFFRFITLNKWKLTLTFSNEEGDLDVYLWDKDTDTIKLDENNRRIGSYGVEDTEVFEGEGPAYIAIIGYNSSSANYTLRVEEIVE
jgi:hypothetical protein